MSDQEKQNKGWTRSTMDAPAEEFIDQKARPSVSQDEQSHRDESRNENNPPPNYRPERDETD